MKTLNIDLECGEKYCEYCFMVSPGMEICKKFGDLTYDFDEGDFLRAEPCIVQAKEKEVMGVGGREKRNIDDLCAEFGKAIDDLGIKLEQAMGALRTIHDMMVNGADISPAKIHNLCHEAIGFWDEKKEDLRKRLQDKEHRDALVSAMTDQTIPFQIRALRLAKHRNWTQEELAQRAGMKQERISMCENPNYGNFSLRTLKQLASAFDVGLIVRFAPFSDLVKWESNLSSEDLEVQSFNQEDYFKEKPEAESSTDLIKIYYSRNP